MLNRETSSLLILSCSKLLSCFCIMAAAAAGIGASTGGVSTIEGHLRGARGGGGSSALGSSAGKLSSCFPALRNTVPPSGTCDSMTGLLSHPQLPAVLSPVSPTECTPAAAALTSTRLRLLSDCNNLPAVATQLRAQIYPYDDDNYTCSRSINDDETIMSTGTLRH